MEQHVRLPFIQRNQLEHVIPSFIKRNPVCIHDVSSMKGTINLHGIALTCNIWILPVEIQREAVRYLIKKKNKKKNSCENTQNVCENPD